MKIKKDKGFTLVETLIVIVIFMIIFSLIFGALLYSFQISRSQQIYNEILDDMSIFIQQLSNDLRQAYTITFPSYSSLNDSTSDFSQSRLIEFSTIDENNHIRKIVYLPGTANSRGMRSILYSLNLSNDNGTTFQQIINSQPLTEKVFRNVIIRRPFWDPRVVEVEIFAESILPYGNTMSIYRTFLISLRQ
ncbi:prepilin cleavage protein [Dictyoglomus thermophilum]|uniref:Prepilin cleavage protein n=1 Tax=Dictyoglomus thermophilum TaxID=14 RepID=A0A7C2GV26_DICTH|nr:prepilin-type N-terminal cleavage/methylation domain-containing protein [Dictyoglomus thermophilum]TYT22512.1 prepilin cleavage protein [Dictyoglomus thermophilum]